MEYVNATTGLASSSAASMFTATEEQDRGERADPVRDSQDAASMSDEENAEPPEPETGRENRWRANSKRAKKLKKQEKAAAKAEEKAQEKAAAEAERVWQAANPECSTCGECCPLDSFPAVPGCAHEAETCDECLDGWVQSQVDNTRVEEGIRCPSSCTRKLTPADLKGILSPEVFQKLENAVTRAALRTMPNYRDCMSDSCFSGQFHDDAVEGNIFRCNECGFRVCTTHEVPFHDGESCAEYDERKKDVPEHEKASNETINRTSRPCPQCKVKIEKVEGCDMMTCNRCWHVFCYTCGAKYRGEGGILEVGNSAHEASCLHWFGGGGMVRLMRDRDPRPGPNPQHVALPAYNLNMLRGVAIHDGPMPTPGAIHASGPHAWRNPRVVDDFLTQVGAEMEENEHVREDTYNRRYRDLNRDRGSTRALTLTREHDETPPTPPPAHHTDVAAYIEREQAIQQEREQTIWQALINAHAARAADTGPVSGRTDDTMLGARRREQTGEVVRLQQQLQESHARAEFLAGAERQLRRRAAQGNEGTTAQPYNLPPNTEFGSMGRPRPPQLDPRITRAPTLAMEVRPPAPAGYDTSMLPPSAILEDESPRFPRTRQNAVSGSGDRSRPANGETLGRRNAVPRERINYESLYDLLNGEQNEFPRRSGFTPEPWASTFLEPNWDGGSIPHDTGTGLSGPSLTLPNRARRDASASSTVRPRPVAHAKEFSAIPTASSRSSTLPMLPLPPRRATTHPRPAATNAGLPAIPTASSRPNPISMVPHPGVRDLTFGSFGAPATPKAPTTALGSTTASTPTLDQDTMARNIQEARVILQAADADVARR